LGDFDKYHTNRLFAMMYGKKDTINKWLLPAVAVLLILHFAEGHSTPALFAGHLSNQQLEPGDRLEQEPNALNASGEPEDPWSSIPVEKRKLKLMLVASIAIILGLFLVVFMISMVRMFRHYRRQVCFRQNPKPSEHPDAWSNYRLKENWQDDLPDEFKKTDTH